MALTQIQSSSISSATKESVAPLRITNVQVANSLWYVQDDTALTPTGGNIIISGVGIPANTQVTFSSTASVSANDIFATSVTRQSSSELRVTTPALALGNYNVRLTTDAGQTALLINGLFVSSLPSWTTSAQLSAVKDIPISTPLNAVGGVTYTLASGSSLPAGLTLAANGLLTGTITGIESETSYTFTIDVIDAENQDASRTFTLNVAMSAVPSYQLWTVGFNTNGKLGLSDTLNRIVYSQIEGTNWQSAAAADGDFTLATKRDGTLWAWGNNGHGQLGLGDIILRSSPVQVGILTNWSGTVAGGTRHSVALKTNGTLWSWGDNSGGALGLSMVGSGPETEKRSEPIQIGTDTDWSTVKAGGWTTFARKTNGTLWGWGANSYGVLGIPDNQSRSSPTQIGSDTNWSNNISIAGNVGAPFYAAGAVRSNGTLWMWGPNSFPWGAAKGQLGLNDIVDRSSPTQVGSDTDWSTLSIGFSSTAAKKTNGTLWTWGGNSYGELGQNEAISKSSPVQVGSDTDWNQIAMTYNFYGTKTNKSLFTSGYGDLLGVGSTTTISSPVQVGSDTTWTLASMNGGITTSYFFIKENNI